MNTEARVTRPQHGACDAVRLSLDPADAPGRHWYVIDQGIIREHGLALDGPPPGGVFAIREAMVLRALRESIRWHELSNDARLDDAVACRAWSFAVDGTWTSKAAAATWARERLTGDGEALVADAMAARTGDGLGQVRWNPSCASPGRL